MLCQAQKDRRVHFPTAVAERRVLRYLKHIRGTASPPLRLIALHRYSPLHCHQNRLGGMEHAT